MHVNSAAQPSTSSDGPSVRIPVDVRRFPWIRRLAADYAYDFRAVAPFFSGDPADRAAWADAIARSQAHTRRRDEIAAVIAAQQAQRQAPPRAREAGRSLADPRTVAVVTGQQAGLFGGPLFTLFKALTAIKLADKVSRDHRVPAAAIFWIDAEDHDWEEVRSCTVLDETLTPRTVSLPARPGADPAPVATIRVDTSIADVLAEIERLLPATEFRSSVVAGLRRAYTPGSGMADAFGRWLEELLGNRGLIVYDSSDPASKPLVSQVFARELSMPGQTVKIAALAGSDLTARGYHAQVHAQDDSLALFHLNQDDGGRRAIRQQDGRFLVGDQQYPAAALVAQATERPAGFSPNVLLRPIVQDTLFPTICYVAGPNELAYLGQLRGVYEHFGVPMPLFYPRATATVLDSAALRFLTKYKLPLEALQAQDEAALNDLLKTQVPQAVEDAFAEAAQTIETHMARFIQTIPALDPTLEGAARSTLERMQRDLQTLHGKMIQAAKRRDETLRRQFIHARALAFPGGHAQERTIGFVSFLNQYGPALVERLDEELPLDLGRHWIVTI
ncbi:MAG: bacillithiol biosynthesis cysteine-adding enzyme BshC [Acidobacteria bacterium]|nr:MAG: bacillithiol biosynthesis cysteine-adding enzyme BshC [Acidobacteriota bacterium]PYR17353.1 MAG: bacillithiol biosynthesis cysteine-adding enzyme BshC [Acidobacteriota bacterium]PYR50559.1 MAG: bacillithiol biosynthesis cysteine-adding enzyme BshC [Acidobacteriota bacterium]